jgi:hypothetical protein
MRLQGRGIDPKAGAQSGCIAVLADRGLLVGSACAAPPTGQLPWRSSWCSRPAERRRNDAGVGGLRDALGGQVAGVSCCPPRPSTVTGPGPSRTCPRRRFRAANRTSSALHHPCSLLRSVRTVPGLSRSEDRGPASPGVRCVAAPPPVTSIARPLPTASRCSRPVAVAPRSHGADGTTRPASRSDLVVSHHLAGLLRAKDRGLVASRCRSWGSPRCSRPAPSAPTFDTARAPTGCGGEAGQLPATLRPFEEFPPLPAVRCHHRLFGPHAVGLHRRGTLQPHPVAGRRW